MSNITRYMLIAALFLLCSCEIFYEPIDYGDVPPSPGERWDGQTLFVKKTTAVPYTPADLSKEMSLAHLLDMALYNNPSTRSTWNAARAAAYAYETSLSSYYPAIDYIGSLNAQTNKGSSFATSGAGVVSSGVPATDNTPRASTNFANTLDLTYLLLDFGGRNAFADQMLQMLYAANWQHNLNLQQVMLTVLNAYTSYVGNKGLVAAYEENLKDAEIALKAALAMKAAGLSTLNDVLLAETNVEQTRTNLVQARGGELSAIGALLIAVGLPADTVLRVENLPTQLPLVQVEGDLSTLLALAAEHRPDLGVAIAAIRQQEAALAISYANSMPKLSANGSWNQVHFISPKQSPGYNEAVFLQLEAPLFHGFFFMNQQRQLRAQIEEAFANLDVQLAAISLQVVTNYYAFRTAEGALPSAEATVEFSARAFQGFTLQYKMGTASIIDMLAALTALSSARAQLILIRTQWSSALANLAFSVGLLGETPATWTDAPPKKFKPHSIKDNDKDSDAKSKPQSPDQKKP